MLKKYLSSLTKEELIEEICSLSRRFKQVHEYYQGSLRAETKQRMYLLHTRSVSDGSFSLVAVILAQCVWVRHVSRSKSLPRCRLM